MGTVLVRLVALEALEPPATGDFARESARRLRQRLEVFEAISQTRSHGFHGPNLGATASCDCIFCDNSDNVSKVPFLPATLSASCAVSPHPIFHLTSFSIAFVDHTNHTSLCLQLLKRLYWLWMIEVIEAIEVIEVKQEAVLWSKGFQKAAAWKCILLVLPFLPLLSEGIDVSFDFPTKLHLENALASALAVAQIWRTRVGNVCCL